jgi:co-chaperonin GroES (HSP10)
MPMQFKIVVRVEKVEEKTNGGIFIPENAQDRRQFEITRGVVVAVGPAAFSDDRQYPPGADRPVVGDRIWFDKHAGTQVKGKRDHMILYRVIEDTDIVGICVDEDAIKELVA